MKSPRSGTSSDEDTAFGLPIRTADHKPGIDHGHPGEAHEGDGNHRLRPREPKDIPQRPLAERVGKHRKDT
jgi:hypothetical protein